MHSIRRFIIIMALLCQCNETLSLIERLPLPSSWTNKQDKESISITKKVERNCNISITNIIGDIEVTASTKDSIKVSAVKSGSLQALESTKVVVEYTEGKAEIKTVQIIKEPGTTECSVSYKIAIPKTGRLSSVHTGQGTITIENGQGAVATTKDGSIAIKNSTGPVEASTDKGAISISLHSILPGQQVTALSGKGDIEISMPAQTVANLDARTKGGGVVTSELPIKTKPTTFKVFNRKAVAKLNRELSGTLGTQSRDSNELPSVILYTDKGNIKVNKS